ncbi:hypothetical protein GJ496_008603 [Pomphorhynchus laevis]|nr:hypothetical protein GJ496_008603 [Pomphorhynchus laevis]
MKQKNIFIISLLATIYRIECSVTLLATEVTSNKLADPCQIVACKNKIDVKIEDELKLLKHLQIKLKTRYHGLCKSDKNKVQTSPTFCLDICDPKQCIAIHCKRAVNQDHTCNNRKYTYRKGFYLNSLDNPISMKNSDSLQKCRDICDTCLNCDAFDYIRSRSKLGQCRLLSFIHRYNNDSLIRRPEAITGFKNFIRCHNLDSNTSFSTDRNDYDKDEGAIKEVFNFKDNEDNRQLDLYLIRSSILVDRMLKQIYILTEIRDLQNDIDGFERYLTNYNSTRSIEKRYSKIKERQTPNLLKRRINDISLAFEKLM